MLLDDELRILLLRLALCLILVAVPEWPAAAAEEPLLPCGFVVMLVLLLRCLWRLWCELVAPSVCVGCVAEGAAVAALLVAEVEVVVGFGAVVEAAAVAAAVDDGL